MKNSYKTIAALVLSILTITSFSLNAQDKAKGIPSVKLKTLDGKIISSDDFKNDGKPIIIDFWATWCKPCVNELNTIQELYGDWKKETGVKLIAISIDDARTMSTVASFVNGKNWDYEVYLDPNSDFKRAMNVNMVPHTFILNGNKEIVSQHSSFAPGDEEKLYEEVKKAAAGVQTKGE
ncbi:MAG: TlpA disulfide reductase family protein [Bacteroidia bacterium]